MELIHHHFETLKSTNDWAKSHLSTFKVDQLTLVTADNQTAGRGQYGRSWVSPPYQNLNLSFCFFVPTLDEPFTLTHLLALSTIQVLKPLPCTIKWPNDVLVHRKKIAGILCETIPNQQGIGVVLGIGLNVNMPPSDLKLINQPATSLLQETGYQYNLKELLHTLAIQFSSDLALYFQKGFSPFEATLRKHLTTAV